MFGIVADLLSSVITILFPAFASYKAIRSGNPAQLTPWLMYWVVLSGILLAESWTVFIIGWFPFYSWIRLFFLAYLVLPQTQGARILFQDYVDPFFEQHERQIEELIGRTHERAKALGLQYFYQLIDLIKEKVLGMPSAPQQQQASAPQPTTAAGYAQALLSRFNLPSTTSATGTTSTGPGAAQGLVVGGDWYSLVTSALGAVTSSASPSSSSSRGPSQPDEQLSASGILHPDRVAKLSRAEKARYYSAHRQRLEVLASALDKEESKLTPTSSEDDDLAYGYGYGSSSTYDAASKIKLRKNGSENSFDQIDADDLSGSASATPRYSSNNEAGSGSGSGGGWTSGWLGTSSSSKGAAAYHKRSSRASYD